MTGMLDVERVYNRRSDRTFAGSRCVVCDEPLEHTLRGERFIQLTCSHVAHEACFYEFIKDVDSQHCPGCNSTLGLDPGRGGNVVNLEKLSQIVRSLQPSSPTFQPSPTPQPWERPSDYGAYPQSAKFRPGHTRDRSDDTVRTAAPSTLAPSSGTLRKRSDVNGSVDMNGHATTTRMSIPRNPIPAPYINIRSEYPNLSRKKEPQSLTCLITVEVPDTNVRPHFGEQQTLQNKPSVIHEAVHDARPPTPPPEDEEEENPETESREELDSIALDLQSRVDNWHGLDFGRFGPLRLHHKLQVGKDARSWQELECYLFSEMLICVKEKRMAERVAWEDDGHVPQRHKATLKGSIMIKKHLESVEPSTDDDNRLSLNLTVPELPLFHLRFPDQKLLGSWHRALSNVNAPPLWRSTDQYKRDPLNGDDEDDERKETNNHTRSSAGTAPSARPNSDSAHSAQQRLAVSIHAPIDLIVVVPISSSMHGIKMELMKDSLRFLLDSLGPRDRMGLVAFGAGSATGPVAGLTSAQWPGWTRSLEVLKPSPQKGPSGDLVQGANVALDMLMQRTGMNPVSSVFVISDSGTSASQNLDFVVQRAEAAKVSIHTFGLGLAHKPDTMVELSGRTEASYLYVKDWMMLRECLAGCLGSLQSVSHKDVRLQLQLPEGAPAKFNTVSGALQTIKRAGGRDVECSLGDLRYGDKRDILVKLTIVPDSATPDGDSNPQDAFDQMVAGLEALGGPLEQDGAVRAPSVEEVPILQADLMYGDIMHHGAATPASRPSLLTITMFAPASKYKKPRPQSAPVPASTYIVQRRMELLTSDMLSRALGLVANGRHEQANQLLKETRSLLRGLGKGGLPPVPPRPGTKPPPTPAPTSAAPAPPVDAVDSKSPATSFGGMSPAAGADPEVVHALDAELEGALEWISHPTVFQRDARKAVLQAIGAIATQRAYTYRSNIETLWASRISGVRDMTAKSREWRQEEVASSSS